MEIHAPTHDANLEGIHFAVAPAVVLDAANADLEGIHVAVPPAVVLDAANAAGLASFLEALLAPAEVLDAANADQ